MTEGSSIKRNLLIPVHVDALAVGSTHERFRWTNLASRYELLRGNWRSGGELRELFTEAASPLQAGIHLHFRLPAAFTHGNLSGSQGSRFPKIPNRWLVIRHGRPEDKLPLRAWIVRSDAEATEQDSKAIVLPVFPLRAPQKDRFEQPLGLVSVGTVESVPEGGTDLDEGDAPDGLELSAVAGGDAGFSAHYPACRSVLGFHDSMEGVQKHVKVSYLVTGWYSSERDDPWHELLETLDWGQPKAKERVEKWLAERRLSCNSLPDWVLKPDPPTGVVCHARVIDVSWRGSDYDYSGGSEFSEFDHPEKYSVSVGNNSAEAFAAHAASMEKPGMTRVDSSFLEDSLTAFQVGLLSRDLTATGMDSELHRLGFSPVDGGKVWMIEAERDSDPVKGVSSRSTVSPVLREKLEQLNRCQQQCDRLERLLRDYRWELYALWCRGTMQQAEGGAAREVATVRKNQENLQRSLPYLTGLLDEAKTDCAAAEKAIGIALKNVTGRPQQLVAAAAPPFYAPNDPVLLVSGPAMRAERTRQSTGLSACRVTGEEFSVFTYDRRNGASGIRVTAEQCLRDRGIAGPLFDALPAAARALAGEAFLLDERARLVADSNNIEVGARTDLAPEKIGSFTWKSNPWIPLYVSWEVQWESEYGEQEMFANPNLICDAWTLEQKAATAMAPLYSNTADISPRASARRPDEAAPGPQSQVYQGYSILVNPLPSARGGSGEAEGDHDLQPIADALRPLIQKGRMMGQSIGGFHEALVMRSVAPQLPPLSFDRFFKDSEDRHFLDPIVDQLANLNPDQSPDSAKPFYPVRTGSIRVLRLWIVDTFGQLVELGGRFAPVRSNRSRRVDADLKTAAETMGAPIRLHPRLTQPARLRFALEPAGGGAGPGAVCGWILPNHLEQSLNLFATNGTALGALQQRFQMKAASQEGGFYWVPVPGTEMSAQSTGNLNRIENVHLRHFARYVLSLSGNKGIAFGKLVDDAIMSTRERTPASDPGSSLLIGRPLALVRASLQLEIPGLPAFDQRLSWSQEIAWSQDVSKGRMHEILARTVKDTFPEPGKELVTDGFEQVRWPVRLGDTRSAEDGLVGFFTGIPQEDRVGPFYPSWGFDLRSERQNLALDFLNPIQVTLLMDPRSKVHATTGVLPRVWLDLPSDDSAGVKQAREFFFQTAPVIGPEPVPQMPTPSDDYGEWSWAYRPDVTGWAEKPNLVAASDAGGFSVPWANISEGWLRLKIRPVQIGSLWIKWRGKGTTGKEKDLRVCLAWSVKGAETLQLSKTVDGRASVEKTWTSPEIPNEVTLDAAVGTIYTLAAADQDGNSDRKQITVVEDKE